MWEWSAHGFATEPQVRAWSWLPAPGTQAAGDGPLAGLRFGVKDVLDVRGMPTLYGCEGLAPQERSWDATVVAQLRAAGAQPIGKTVTAEFAFMHPGPTTNPWHAAHTPGGSSSGSAAAVAAGMVDFAIGTQTGGSIIRPAAYCGVVGFKPSFGLLPRQGMLVTAETLDTIGWLTAHVPLSAQLLHCLTGQAVPAPCLPRKVAVLRGWPALESHVQQVLEHAVQCVQQAGVQVVDVPALAEHMPRLAALHHVVNRYEVARGMAGVAQVEGGRLSASMHAAMQEGLGIDWASYHAAQQERYALAQQLQVLLAEVDAVLAPSAQGFAPQGVHSTGSSLPLRPWSLLGWPCLHLPCAREQSTGLPQGVQLVTKLGQDAWLHAYAQAVADVLTPTIVSPPPAAA